MTQYRSSYDKPASNIIPFTVIGLSVVMGLYAILALPVHGDTRSSIAATLRSLVSADYSISTPVSHTWNI